MAVPKNVLQVPRPKNTVVSAYGVKKDRYAVRARKGMKVYSDGRSRPVNGKTIGHIINGEYIPKKESEMYPDSVEDVRDNKEWGASMLCDRLAKQLLLDLTKVFNYKESVNLFCMAVIKVLEPDIRDYQIQGAFRESWLSQMYPMAALSKSSISSLLEKVGRQSSNIVKFLHLQTSELKESDILAVDGTLKRNNSRVNTYSRYSRNYHKKGELGNISVLYAMDLNTGIPKAFKAYPGNVSDSNAYSDFIKSSGIERGLVIGDKAFSESAAREEFKAHPQLHFLHPLKRNAKIIQVLKLRRYQGVLPGFSGVFYKKASYYDEDIKKTIYLYSYLDAGILSQELKTWGDQNRELDPAKFEEELEEKLPGFGTILLQSDLDLSPLQAYLLYKGRWQIELLMRLYKQAIMANITGKHSNSSVIGSELVNFLALSIKVLLRKYLIEKGVLDKSSFKAVMKRLKGAVMEKLPDKEDWELRTMSTKDKVLLQTLELLPSEPPKKRGRPRKVKNSSNAKATRMKAQANSNQPAKRGPGRPPGAKNKKTLERERLQSLKQQGNPDLITVPLKRGRGRPPGAKNKKTIERERQAALAKAAQEKQIFA